jgi:hypothetical protein
LAFDPLFPEIPATTVNEIIDGYIYQNSYIATPMQRYFRASGAYDPFGGGAAMQLPFLYAGAQGGAISPGSDVTLNRTQMLTANEFAPKLYEKHIPVEEFGLEVLNTGPNARVGLLEAYLEQMLEGLDFQIEADMFRHGQDLGPGVTDARIYSINGFSEAMNDGVTPSWDGNVFQTYGSQKRNGAVNASLNSTPTWLGDASGNPAPPSYQQLLKIYKTVIGRPNFIVTSWSGYTAIAAAFQRQQRYETRDDQHINWSGIKFEDATIFDDDIVPSPNPKPSIANLFNTPGAIQTGTFVVAAGQPSALNQLPVAGITVTVGDPIWMLDVDSWRYRPARTEEFNYKMMDPIRWPQNPTMYSQFLRHSLNFYCPTPRRNIGAYGIKS